MLLSHLKQTEKVCWNVIMLCRFLFSAYHNPTHSVKFINPFCIFTMLFSSVLTPACLVRQHSVLCLCPNYLEQLFQKAFTWSVNLNVNKSHASVQKEIFHAVTFTKTSHSYCGYSAITTDERSDYTTKLTTTCNR